MKPLSRLMHLIALALIVPAQAFASLGGNVGSVEADQVHMKATSRVATAKATHTVHEIQASSGTMIREYVAADGTVFGVAWSGPVIPDLRQLLGPYFTTFTAAANVQQAGHKHLLIQQRELVVRSSGHMRAFKGSAFVPSLLPQGVTAADIQ